MHESKIAARRWRDKKEQEIKEIEKMKRKEKRQDLIIEKEMKRGKSEVAGEAYEKWCANKEKQARTEKIIRKFRKDLEFMNGLEEERPWR